MNFGFVLAVALLATQPAPTAGADPAANAIVTPAVGQPAPDFAYQSQDGYWRNLHDVLVAGDVLLVFGPSDEQLRSLQRDRESLLSRGIVPLGVMTMRDGQVWNAVRRDGVEFSVLADPHSTIAGQYGAAPAAGGSHMEWFVIDHAGRVRASGEGSPVSRDWAALAASALGRDPVRTASAH